MNVRNHVQLIGRVGLQPEIVTTTEGRKIANMQLATNHAYTASNGERKEETEWHRIVAYSKFAEVIEQKVAKGSELMVHGSLRTRKWTDKGGVDHWTTEIIVGHLTVMNQSRIEQ